MNAKKMFLSMGLILFSAGLLYAQSSEERKSSFQLTFVPPLGTQGIFASQYTNQVSLNIIAGISKNENVFTLGGVANLVKENASGFQLAGVTNYVGNSSSGFQLAGVYNGIGGEGNGILMAGVANSSRAYSGTQIAGVMNVAGNLDGTQLAGVINVAKRVKGVQIAALLNIAEESDYPSKLLFVLANHIS
ncbi:hypothetical protein [Massilibacteroides sp.]|uniref:hypothetical protein n=1 Tax=Massilibacteroides sp. TaxID=2034766 RepID=UPI00260BDCC8|nr:hypothetical protein [Massilibacteroides sp.]MDD4514487.1 hypothetical protein [Massilibacteroides sp.]